MLEFYKIKTRKLLRHKQRNMQLLDAKCCNLQHPNYYVLNFIVYSYLQNTSLLVVVICFKFIELVIELMMMKIMCLHQ